MFSLIKICLIIEIRLINYTKESSVMIYIYSIKTKTSLIYVYILDIDRKKNSIFAPTWISRHINNIICNFLFKTAVNLTRVNWNPGYPKDFWKPQTHIIILHGNNLNALLWDVKLTLIKNINLAHKEIFNLFDLKILKNITVINYIHI